MKIIKIAGCPASQSIKEPQVVSGLKIKDSFWDFACHECGLPMLRLLRVTFMMMHSCAANIRCKNCDAAHRVKLHRKRVNTFQILVERDYTDQTVQFAKTQIFQTEWKRRKFSKDTVEKVYSKGKGKCWHCKIKIKLADYGVTWHIDHDIPLSRQGNHDLKNLLPACGSCNRSKHNATSREFKAGKSYQRSEDDLLR